MSGITAREVLDAFRSWVEATPCADAASAEDRFVALLDVSEFRNVEADRRFYALPVEGPEQVRGSTCNDYMIVELSCRWLNAWESQRRMLDDLEALRARVKGFARGHAYVYTTRIEAPWRHDHVTLATSVVASIRVRIEYHRSTA